jgi:mannosyl-3-phosphoglycerate phosphatase
MVALQAELHLDSPLIVENGGAVFAAEGTPGAELLPERYHGVPARVFGATYPALREGLALLREAFGQRVKGFGDMDVAGVARWTGLPARLAKLASRREFDEPFRWQPPPSPEEEDRARQLLAERGLHLTRGGRFWHVTGNNDKGRAVRWLLDRWEEESGVRPASLALGDSENDLPMLAAVDQGVLVERPGRGHLAPRPPGVLTVDGEGPVGWNRAALDWLESLGLGK